MSDTRTTSEEQAAAWWASLDPRAVYWDRVVGMSDVEVRMLSAVRG